MLEYGHVSCGISSLSVIARADAGAGGFVARPLILPERSISVSSNSAFSLFCCANRGLPVGQLARLCFGSPLVRGRTHTRLICRSVSENPVNLFCAPVAARTAEATNRITSKSFYRNRVSEKSNCPSLSLTVGPDRQVIYWSVISLTYKNTNGAADTFSLLVKDEETSERTTSDHVWFHIERTSGPLSSCLSEWQVAGGACCGWKSGLGVHAYASCDPKAGVNCDSIAI